MALRGWVNWTETSHGRPEDPWQLTKPNKTLSIATVLSSVPSLQNNGLALETTAAAAAAVVARAQSRPAADGDEVTDKKR